MIRFLCGDTNRARYRQTTLILALETVMVLSRDKSGRRRTDVDAVHGPQEREWYVHWCHAVNGFMRTLGKARGGI